MVSKTFALSPQGKIGAFTVDGSIVKANGRTVIQTAPFGKIAVVDVVGRQSNDPQDHIIMDAFVGQLTKAGYAIRYDTNTRNFFDPKVRWAEFLEKGETSGVELTDEEKVIADSFQLLYKKFETAFTLPKPKYNFAGPNQQGVKYTTLKATSDRRVRSSEGYSGTLKSAEGIWQLASKHWNNVSEDSTSTSLLATLPSRSFDGYSRRTIVFRDHLSIGCQNISRKALEDLAIEQGWDFPSE